MVWVVQENQLTVSQNFETSQELRNGEIVWMNAFQLTQFVKNVETLDKILDLLHESLLVEFFDQIFFLFQSGHRLVAREVGIECIYQH